jgi:mono/diheme cytochrome c family protein
MWFGFSELLCENFRSERICRRIEGHGMEEQTPARTQNQRNLLVIFGLFLVVAAGGAAFLYYQSDWRVPAQMKKLQNPVPANNEAVGAGMMVYMDHCQSCHGENGDGRGPKAEQLSVAPANFMDTHTMSAVTDGELFWKITHGRRPMPSFKDKLNDEERWQLVVYIRTLAAKPNAGAPARP